MTELTRSTRKTLMQLLNSLLVETKEFTRETIKEGFLGRGIPSDLNPSPDKPWLYLKGKSYQLYYESLARLSAEVAFEYMTQDETDEQLWHLVCETALAEGSPRTVQGNKQRVDDFIQRLARPIVEFEVLVPIDHLRVGDRQISIQTISLKRMTSDELRSWGMTKDSEVQKLKGKTFAVVREAGTHYGKAIGRARMKISHALDILIAALAVRRTIRDEELMFELTEAAFAKDPEGKVWSRWDRSYRSIDLVLDAESEENLAEEIRKVVSFMENPRISSEMKNQLTVALANLRKAARSSSFDDKVNFLFIALEALLQTKADHSKGEAISARLMLLSIEEGGGFFDPALTLALYDLRRSATIHGEGIDIAHDREYQDLFLRANQAIRAFIAIVGREGLQNRQALFRWLLQRGKAPDLVGWLKEHDSPYARRIRKWFEGQRAQTKGRDP